LAIELGKPIEFSPITRRPVLGFIPLGVHPSHIKSTNSTLASLFGGGKLLGNSDFWFAVMYFLIIQGKISYAKEEMTTFFTNRMLFRLKNSISSASLTGLSGYVQSKMRLDAAVYFTLCSSLFLPPPEPAYDTLRYHLLHVNELLALADLAKLKIPSVLIKHIHRTQLTFQLLNMSKKPNGKRILANIQRALYQNSIPINSDNIGADLLEKNDNDIYKYPQFTLPFVPIDGPAKEENIVIAINLLPPLAKIFSVIEIYNLIESLLFIIYYICNLNLFIIYLLLIKFAMIHKNQV
jgi:hypothetical protein